jgi:myosin heavy subunit
MITEFLSLKTQGDSAATFKNESDLDKICELLGFNTVELKRCLTSRNFGKRSIVTVFYTVTQVLIV